MKLSNLYHSQQLAVSKETLWSFFSNPNNLITLTPPNMHLSITSKLPTSVYPGMIMTYSISPILGLFHWVGEITQVREGERFVDEQRFGPFKFWHHQHILQEKENGTEVQDILHYALPFGWAGKMAHRAVRKLEETFDYRRKKLDELFRSY